MYLLTLDWSLSMRHNVLIIWKKHTHSLSAGIYQSQQWSLHAACIQEAAPGFCIIHAFAGFMNETCFCSGGWLQLQWLCNFIRTGACPVSFIISSLTEVTAGPGLQARLCLDAHVVDSHERQHPAEHRAAARWSLSFPVPICLSGLCYTG